MSYTASYINAIFKNVHPSWKKVILSDKIKPEFKKCLQQIDQDLINKGVTKSNIANNGINMYLRPNIENTLEAFKMSSLKDLKAIVVGQDPYPKAKHAHGLSFSSMHTTTPESVKAIFKCMVHNKHINSTPDNGDLTAWARQGILLLNVYLTRTPEIHNGAVINDGSKNKANLHIFWGKFTLKLLEYLSGDVFKNATIKMNHEVFVLLWGGHAQKCRKYIDEDISERQNKFTVLEWGHPSPLNRANQDSNNAKNFLYCDHFRKISMKHTIDWNMDNTKSVIRQRTNIAVFTDGGCTGNGKDSAMAAYGVYFPGKFMEQTTAIMTDVKLSKIVPNRILEFDEINESILVTTTFTKRTNQRAELMATIMTFKYLYENWGSITDKYEVSKIIFVTDSLRYVISWLGTRIWTVYEKNKDFKNIPNSDMVKLLQEFLLRFGRKLANDENISFGELKEILITNKFLILKHQNSHLTQVAKAKLSSKDREYVAGNEIADILCTNSMKNA